MIDPTQQALAEGALALASSGAKARQWVQRIAPSAKRLANEEHSLVEATRRAENLARKLAQSSSRRNSAGVFGPSQAGKSYLVSVLGRSKDKPLLVDFAGESKNFIQEINPEGGKEATGLVTRFTIVRGTRDRNFPVELRLLTETDLVKIIGNSFLSDFDDHNRRLTLPDESQVLTTIERLEAQARQPVAHLDDITMFDIGEYFRGNFSQSIDSLNRGRFWDALTRFGHRLPTAARAELYSLLWGCAPALTEVFLLLVRTLEELNHAATARAALTSLMPRARSIIDVDILKNHLGTPDDQKDRIGVVPELTDGDGPVVEVARATLTALVAEIKVVMSDKPWGFFEHTDLLDFPGARSREKMLDLPPDPQERAFCVRNMLLRGKIAYLFQRYTEERELTSMLLCMPPSNQEVKDLTSLVGKWVAQTHGDNAQSRAQLPCALFFVLTKFDIELTEKPGDTAESFGNRIDTRLAASMYQLYEHEDWLQNWNGKPFSNTYFLRNPGFKLEGVFQYAGEGDERREAGLAPSAEGRIAATRHGMVSSERCVRHFTHPGLAWDSALTLNDGGVQYLVDNLERVLSPRLKTRQLAGRLVDQASVLDARLRTYYAAGDDASRKEKEAALIALRKTLYAACQATKFRNFPLLMGRLKLREADIRAAFLAVASMRVDEASLTAAAAGIKATAAPDPWDDDPWAEASEPAGGDSTQPPRPLARDRMDQFAAAVLNLWAERVHGLVADSRALTAMGLDGKTAGSLAEELVIGAHRCGLVDQIASRTRSQIAAAIVRWDEVADRAAGIAATVINDYVSWLGFGGLPADQRPGMPEPPRPRQKAVFEPPPLPGRGHMPELSEVRVAQDREHFLEWGVAFRQLGLDNVSFAGGREISEGDNRLLGTILEEMSAALRVEIPER